MVEGTKKHKAHKEIMESRFGELDVTNAMKIND